MCATIFIGPSLVLHKILLPWDFSELTRINKIPTLPESYQRPKFVVKVGRGRKMSKYSNFANSEWHLCEGWNQKEHLREAGTDRNALGYRRTPNLERYKPDFWAIRNICCLCLQEMKVREPSGRSCELSAGLARLMCVCWWRQEQDGVGEVPPDFAYLLQASCEGPHPTSSADHNVPWGSN